jgi:hypothetical protein
MTVVAIGLPPLRMTVGRQGPILIHWAFGPSLSQRDARFRHGLVDPVAAAVSQTLAAIVAAIRSGLVRVSSHALAEAEADDLVLSEIEAATCAGECIEDYPSDPRGPSCLVLGRRADGSAVHLVWGFDERVRQAILITVYLPDIHHWAEGFRMRRARDVGEAE